MIRKTTYPRGDRIIAEGDYGSEVYIIEHGRVEVYREGPPPLCLTILGPGEIFGEMAWITEMPRSASVRAIENVEVMVLDHEGLPVLLRTKPEVLLPVLRVLSERLRTLTSLVGELRQHAPNADEVIHAHLGPGADLGCPSSQAATGTHQATIAGLTPRATASIGGRPLPIDRFPYRIGSTTPSEDPVSQNDLTLPNEYPTNVSRNHCMVARVDSRFSLIDRGSRLGTIVNGARIGGGKGTGRAELHDGDNEVVIGGPASPYRFRLTVSRRA